MRKTLLIALAAFAAVALIAGTGCRRVPIEQDTSPWNRDSGSETIDVDVSREGAERVTVKVRMGAGQLELGSTDTSDAVAVGEVIHPLRWPVDVDYSVAATSGDLEIVQRSDEGAPVGRAESIWDLDFAKGLPFEMNVELGAGESSLRLGELALEDLEVTLGAGEATLNLVGERTADLPVDIMHGVGELTLELPSDVGVRVRGANGGVGDISIDGLTVDGDDYVNEAWSGSGPKIDIRLQRGIGQVNLVVVD